MSNLVLEGTRLALRTVNNDDRRLVLAVTVVDHRLKLASERKSRAALPAQIDLLARRDQLVSRHSRQRAEDVAVRVQIDPRHAVKAGGQPGGPDPHDRGHI
jgi:hypothetical protein